MRCARLWMLLLIASTPSVPAVAQPSVAGRLARARAALSAQDVDAAAAELEALGDALPADARARAELGRLRFYQGRYADAAELLHAAVRDLGPHAPVQISELAGMARATAELTASFSEQHSADGRYSVRLPADQALLAPYALETLRQADALLTDVLGGDRPRPLRLEIYATAADLARVSPLTQEAIETSGTIALAKYDKLMITSPRALIRGYPWRDTIAHELTHLVLARVSRGRAPVWLQEGTAKLLERRWREPDADPLDPVGRGLLAEAARDHQWIPFSRLHPSIALLPSQRSAALAFAEVTHFMARFERRAGTGALARVATALARGDDARTAVAAEAGRPWAELEREARATLPRAPPGPADFRPLRFAHAGSGEEAEGASPREVRERLRLGDLLTEGGHASAARIEFEAASRAAPPDPDVAWRLARAALASQRPEDARDVLVAMARRTPDHEPVLAWLAQALRATGDASGASRAARRAIGVNPFDPLPHCVLAETAESPRERAEEGDRCRELR